jgi:hypothetical protein
MRTHCRARLVDLARAGPVTFRAGHGFKLAMMCVHGDAGLGKTLSVNASLRALAPAVVCQVHARARPPPVIRHVLFDALGMSGTPPIPERRPIEPAIGLRTRMHIIAAPPSAPVVMGQKPPPRSA